MSVDLAALGVYDQDTAAEDAYARVLLLGPAKLGKTSCLTLTAPERDGGCLVLNCDGIAATKGAAAQGARFKAIDCTDRKSWQDGCRNAKTLAEQGMCSTIIVDTVTLLQDAIITDAQRTLQGRDLWQEVLQVVMKGISLLKMAPAHLFVVAHMIPGRNEEEGILPLVAGQAAERIPAIMHDAVLFVYDENRTHPQAHVQNRFFALGPQGSWRFGGRHVKQSCQIPADVGTLFEHMGINP